MSGFAVDSLVYGYMVVVFPASAYSRVVEQWAPQHLVPEPGTVEQFVYGNSQ